MRDRSILEELSALSLPPLLRQRGNTAERVDVSVKRVLVERLGEHIGPIEIRGHVMDRHLAQSNELAHLQEAALNVA